MLYIYLLAKVIIEVVHEVLGEWAVSPSLWGHGYPRHSGGVWPGVLLPRHGRHLHYPHGPTDCVS